MPPRVINDAARMFRVMATMALTWADLFAYYVLWMTMTYLTNVWKISFTFAAAIINLWSGASQMLPLALAHLADAFVGHFSILLISTLSYSVGLGLLAMSTPPVLAKHFGTCSDYKPECIGQDQKHLFFIGLGLIPIGTAGYLTSLEAFATDQLDEGDGEDEGPNNQLDEGDDEDEGPNNQLDEGDGEDEGPNNQLNINMGVCTAFFLASIAIVLVPVAGIIVIPYVKPWSVRYGIAAIFSMVAMVIFLGGCYWYNYVGPRGSSPLTIIVRVFVASTTKLFCRSPKNVDQLYEWPVPGDESLSHTNSLCCLDKAAIIEQNKPLEQQENNRWRLCTITEVEETKIFIRMIPMWLTFITCGLVSSVGNTYFLEQANHMNQKVGGLHVPLTVLLLVYDLAKSQSAKLYFRLASCTSRGQNPSRYAPPVGIAVSMVFAVLCCITAAKVESRRLDVVTSHGLVDKPDERIPMTMFWLIPQFILLGALDGLYNNSIACFFVDQVRPSMRKYLEYFSSVVFGSGVMGSAVSVYVVGRISERGGRMNWFQSTINKSRMDRYYWVLAALSVVNLVLYGAAACLYSYREARNEGMEAEPLQEERDVVIGVDVE